MTTVLFFINTSYRTVLTFDTLRLPRVVRDYSIANYIKWTLKYIWPTIMVICLPGYVEYRKISIKLIESHLNRTNSTQLYQSRVGLHIE